MIKVLGRVSSINVRKVLWTLKEIGLEFEQEDYGAGFRSTQTDEYLSLNPNGLVPVYQDEDCILWESNTICRYLAAKHGRTDLLPDIPRDRAKVEMWMDWSSTSLNSSWLYAFMALVREHPAFNSETQLGNSIKEWNRHIGILNDQLAASGPYITGNTFTLADILLGLSVNRWLMTPMDREDYPVVMAYFEKLKERPACLEYCSCT